MLSDSLAMVKYALDLYNQQGMSYPKGLACIIMTLGQSVPKGCNPAVCTSIFQYPEYFATHMICYC